jgi:dipeptidyl aminopeptidase/acylaminoacyl peptidase
MSTTRIPRVGVVGLGVTVVFLAAASGAAPTPASESRLAAESAPTRARIAFISYPRSRSVGPNNKLYVVNADGSGWRLLTRKAWQELAWSPDGREIAFAGLRIPGGEIRVVRADGHGARTLIRSSTEAFFFPSWSPDGRTIAFGKLLRDGHSEVHLINADGSGHRVLTRDGQDPVWLPGGRQIAFTRIPAGTGRFFESYVINADGSGERNLTREWGIDNGPSWSPDGRKIAFGSSRDGNPEIYVMNANGTGARRLTRNPAADNDSWWSPDGRRIAFVRESGGSSAIYVMNADGSGQRRLTGNGRHPHWSPDGRMIAFARRLSANWEIYVMDADGSRQRNLTRTPKGNEESHFAWAPRQEKRRSSMRGSTALVRASVDVVPGAEYRARAGAICRAESKWLRAVERRLFGPPPYNIDTGTLKDWATWHRAAASFSEQSLVKLRALPLPPEADRARLNKWFSLAERLPNLLRRIATAAAAGNTVQYQTLLRKRVRLTHRADEAGYLLLPPQCPVYLPA